LTTGPAFIVVVSTTTTVVVVVEVSDFLSVVARCTIGSA